MRISLKKVAHNLDMDYITGKNAEERISVLLNHQMQYAILSGNLEKRKNAEHRRQIWETAKREKNV